MSFPGNTTSNPHNRRSQGRQSCYQGVPQENTSHTTGSEPRSGPQHRVSAQCHESDDQRTNIAMGGKIQALFEQMSQIRNQYREQQEQQQAPVAGPPEWKPKISMATAHLQDKFFPRLFRSFFYELLSVTLIQGVCIGNGIALKGNSFGHCMALWAVIAVGMIIANEGSGGYLNPAFTLTFALFRGFAPHTGKMTTLLWGVVYVLAQILGGVCGAGIVRGFWTDEFAAEAKKETKKLGSATPGSRLARLVTVGGDNAKTDVGAEVLCCAFVVYIIFFISDKNHKVIPRHVRPATIGGAYALFVLFVSSRPLPLKSARDLGPRLMATWEDYMDGGAWDSSYIWVTMLMSLLVTPCVCLWYDVVLHDWNRSATAGEAEVMTDAQERSGPFHPLRAACRSVVRSRKDDPEFREIWAIPHPDWPQSSRSQW